MVTGRTPAGDQWQALPALHALLLGLTVYVAAHDSATIYVHMPDPAWLGGWLSPVLAVANLLLRLLTAPPQRRNAVTRALLHPPPVPAAAAGFLALYGLAYTLSTHASLVGWSQITTTCVCCYVLALALATTGESLFTLLSGLSIGGVAICVEGLLQLLPRVRTPEQLMAVNGSRYASGDPFLANRLGNGSLPYPTLLVSLFLVFGSLALGLAATSRTWLARLAALAAWLLNGICAWLTASRGGVAIFILMSLAHGGAAALWHAPRPHLNRAIAAISLTTALLFAGIVARLVLTKGSMLRADGSLSSRVKMWRICWHVFRANPLTGGGPGAFGEAWRAFIRTNSFPEYSVPHSLYFGILCEGGLMLFAAAAALFAGLAVETWRIIKSPVSETDRRLVLAFALGLLAVLTHDLNENSFQMHPIYLLSAVFAAIVIGLRAAHPPNARP